jgi:hypothetical protein
MTIALWSDACTARDCFRRGCERLAAHHQTAGMDEEHPRGEPLVYRRLHRQSVGVLTSLRRVPSHGLRFRSRLLASVS